MHRGFSYWICAFFALCLPLQKGGLLYTLTEHSSLWSMMFIFLLSSTVRRSGQAVYNASIFPHVGVGKNQEPDCQKSQAIFLGSNCMAITFRSTAMNMAFPVISIAKKRHLQQCALTDARLLDTLTGPSSLWSMSPLPSPFQDGNSSWIFTMGIRHTALWNAMLSIQNSNELLSSTPFCPSQELQGMMSRCTFWHGQVLPARSNSHAAGQHTHPNHPKSIPIQ